MVAVPTTANSKVKDEASNAISKAPGPRYTGTKVVENPGLSVMAGVSGKGVFKRKNCGRAKCPLKYNEKGCKEICYKENITYQGSCKICKQEKIREGRKENEIGDVVYEGETSRSLFTRVNNHLEDLRKMVIKGEFENEDDENEDEVEMTGFMWKHMREKHNEVLKELNAENIEKAREFFNFKVTGNYRDPLTRQITEMIRIRRALRKATFNAEKGIKFQQLIEGCMNSKIESFEPFDKNKLRIMRRKR